MNKKYLLYSFVAVMGSMALSSCHPNLLDQDPTTVVASNQFWKTEADATYALNGAYAEVRRLFDRDYMFDGMSETLRYRANGSSSQSTGDRAIAYRSGRYDNPSNPGSYNNYYQYSYAGINRCNYVIQHVNEMLETCKESSRASLEAIVGEARMLRGMVYFRLMQMWGDVVVLDKIIESNDEVQEAERTPIKDVYKLVYEDFTYAYEKLPNRSPQVGRQNKWGALALRGKLQLYWACWNRTSWPWTVSQILAPQGGWPELNGFTADNAASEAAYKSAAEDFKTVIKESGITLYKNGEPGECSPLGECDKLPNYYYLFTPQANNDPSLLVAFAHGTTGTSQGDELMRDFGTRATQGSQGWGQPRFSMFNRYQSTITGDFCDPIKYYKPTDATGYTQPNSSTNPATYDNRDWRMKSSMLWEGETMYCMLNLSFDRYRRYRYQQRTGTVAQYSAPNDAINADADNEGTIMRKFIINWAGINRNEGYYNWPSVRMADVYLMYAEAANEAYGPTGDGGLALEVVNKVRHRGNLPALAPAKYADKETFFYAIENERVVELFAEGHRWFDLRRWRSIERIWCAPQTSGGVKLYDAAGSNRSTYFNNTSERNYHRLYIGQIPTSERNRNPKLTQNDPWL